MPFLRKLSSISSTFDSRASRPSRRVIEAHSMNIVINSDLLINFFLTKIILNRLGIFLTSLKGKAMKIEAAVPTKIIT
ncbi:hypothetical protein D3C81_1998270 [compost metagenome]